QLGELLGHGRRDLLGPVVELRRQRVHVEIETPPARDRPHVQRERPAGDDSDRHAGKASWSTKRSLKSGRSDSSTYSTSCTSAAAAARSWAGGRIIFAPSPATLPAATMRGR